MWNRRDTAPPSSRPVVRRPQGQPPPPPVANGHVPGFGGRPANGAVPNSHDVVMNGRAHSSSGPRGRPPEKCKLYFLFFFFLLKKKKGFAVETLEGVILILLITVEETFRCTASSSVKANGNYLDIHYIERLTPSSVSTANSIND